MPEYNKLVRGNIPDIIRANGEVPITRILGNEEYETELLKKPLEEASELVEAQTTEEKVEELADLKQAVLELEELYGPEKVEAARLKKLQERGGFAPRVFLERTE